MTTLTDVTDDLRSLVVSNAGAPNVIDRGLTLIRLVAEDRIIVEAKEHPLGFIQIKLATYPEFSLRLHLWPIPEIPAQDPVWLIHRHGWLLRSFVLRGVAVNHEYVVQQDPSGTHRLYDVKYSDDVSTLKPTETRVSYSLGEEKRHTAPAMYEVASDAFHATVNASDEPAATLAIVYHEKDSVPLVVGAAEGAESYDFHRRQMPQSLVQQAMSQLS